MEKRDEKTAIEFAVLILNRLRAESNKRNVLYKHGVDLMNYENAYSQCAIDLLSFVLGEDLKDEIEWWLFENVKKVYYDNEGKVLANVESAKDFIEYNLSVKSKKEFVPGTQPTDFDKLLEVLNNQNPEHLREDRYTASDYEITESLGKKFVIEHNGRVEFAFDNKGRFMYCLNLGE